jgi:DNA-binding CsgD family transcriptional regulator
VLAAARQAANLELVLLTHGWRFFAFLERGDIRQAETELEAQVSISARLRQRTYVLALLGNRITLALMRGELAAAERLIVQSMTQLRGLVSGNEAMLSVLIFTLRREQGRLSELRPLISAFLGQSTAASVWRPGLALLYLEVGDRATARAEFERIATQGFNAISRDGRWLTCIVYLTEVCVALGDVRRAEELQQLLLPYVGRNIVGGRLVCFGSADRYLGLLAATLSRWTDAARHFEQALAMNQAIEAHAPLAHTKHDYATTLLARNGAGDRDRAAALLQECLESARSMGMHALEEKSASRLEGLAPIFQGTKRGGDELTSRETEVLRLIAIGRSNADIAMVLEISLNTVATHVRNILAKTGCANRTEAAAYAMRHALA